MEDQNNIASSSESRGSLLTGDALAIFGSFQGKMESFLKNMNTVLAGKDVPKWFKEFSLSLDSFAMDIALTFKEIETKYIQTKATFQSKKL